MNRNTQSLRRRKAGSIAELSRLELAVLQHIARYRITMRSAWRGAWEFSMFSHDQLARTVRRLTSWGLIRRTAMLQSAYRFELDCLGARILGLSPERSRPLQGAALFRAYAQLLFATSRRLMLANQEDYPVLEPASACEDAHPHGLPWGHFFDPNDRSRWFRLIVDKHLRTKANRVAVQTWRSIQSTPLWVDGGCRPPVTQLIYTVMTPSRRRAERISSRLRRFGGTPIPTIQISVAPELIPLIERRK